MALYSRPDSLLFRREHVRMTHDYYERHGGKTVVLAQFIPILRTFAPVVAGVGEMGYRRFATYNVLGAILWVTSMTLAGYTLGNMVPNIEQRIHYVVAARDRGLAAAAGHRLAPQPQKREHRGVAAMTLRRASDLTTRAATRRGDRHGGRLLGAGRNGHEPGNAASPTGSGGCSDRVASDRYTLPRASGARLPFRPRSA